MVWYSHLSEFSTVCCDPHSQRFGVVNKTEIDVFLELSCYFCDSTDVSNLINIIRAKLLAEEKEYILHFAYAFGSLIREKLRLAVFQFGLSVLQLDVTWG